MSDQPNKLRTAALISDAFGALFRMPFAFLVFLGLMIWGVSRTIETYDGGGMLSLLFLTVVGAYLHIAAILAAAEVEPDASADSWLRAAFSRRTFWRYTFTELTVVLLVLLGAVLFIFPSFVVGAAIGIAAPAAVLENRFPGASLRRAFELSEGHRIGTGIIYGLLVWMPLLVLQVGYQLGWQEELGIAWIVAEGLMVIVETAGIIALARTFLALGGTVEPTRTPEGR